MDLSQIGSRKGGGTRKGREANELQSRNSGKQKTEKQRSEQEWADMGRIGQICAGVGRYGQEWADMCRSGQIWAGVGRYGPKMKV